jgi:hypothetical protein
MSQDSHVLAPDPAVDLAVTEAMVEELEQYIIKEDLYRTVITRTPQGEVRVQMTGGDLLTRLFRLNAEKAGLAPSLQQRIDAVTKNAEQTIYSLKSRFHARLVREMRARLDSLRWFLDDAAESPAAARANYPYEIRNRQRVEEILKRLGKETPAELQGQLEMVDRRLRSFAIGSEFVWDPALRDVFPQYPYWYLYARV